MNYGELVIFRVTKLPRSHMSVRKFKQIFNLNREKITSAHIDSRGEEKPNQENKSCHRRAERPRGRLAGREEEEAAIVEL